MLGGLRARLDEDPILRGAVVPGRGARPARAGRAWRGVRRARAALRVALPRDRRPRRLPRRAVASDVQRELLLEATVERARLSVLAESAAPAGLRARGGAARGRARARAGGPGPLHPGAAGVGRGRAAARLRGRGGVRSTAATAARSSDAGPGGPRAVRLARARRAAARARALGRHPGLRLRLRRLHRAGAGRARDAGRALRRARGACRCRSSRAARRSGPPRRCTRGCPSWPRERVELAAVDEHYAAGSRAALHQVERGLFETATRRPRGGRRRDRLPLGGRGAGRGGAGGGAGARAAPRRHRARATWPWCSAIRRATRRSSSRCSAPTACPTRSTARCRSPTPGSAAACSR